MHLKSESAAAKTQAAEGDVLVVCCRSGLVVLLEAAVLPIPVVTETRYDFHLRELIYTGTTYRFAGRICAGCRSNPSDAPKTAKPLSCLYRPLVWPLFVPR